MSDSQFTIKKSTINPKTISFIKFCGSLLLALLMFFPVFTVILGGFKTKGQLMADPFGIPTPFTLETYKSILARSGDFWGFLWNSSLIAVVTVLIVLVSGMAAGVALSRLEFKGRKLLFNFFIMGMLFPFTVAILPLYLQLRNMGLLGHRAGVILTEAAFNLPLCVFIFTGFFKDIPRDLQDACEIDGGGIFVFFSKVIIPLSTPVVSTVSVLAFVQSWNQFLLPLLVLDDVKLATIPLGVMNYQGQFTTGWNLIMAFITLSLIPIAIFYLLMQKYIVAGLTAGAIKG